jgi:hypothetical protein
MTERTEGVADRTTSRASVLPDAPGPGDGGDDWPAQAADTIVRVVGTVRDKTTGPALTVARGLVYGLLALVLGSTALVLLAIGSVRLIDAYLPDAVFGETHTWAAHLLVGLAFTGAGGVLWSMRRPRPAEGR